MIEWIFFYILLFGFCAKPHFLLTTMFYNRKLSLKCCCCWTYNMGSVCWMAGGNTNHKESAIKQKTLTFTFQVFCKKKKKYWRGSSFFSVMRSRLMIHRPSNGSIAGVYVCIIVLLLRVALLVFNIRLNARAQFHLHTSILSKPLGGCNDHTGTCVPPQMRSFLLRFTSSSSSFSPACMISPTENLPSALKTQQWIFRKPASPLTH